MGIDSKYLYSAVAEEKSYRSGELIFTEGSQSSFYFQVMEGKVSFEPKTAMKKNFYRKLILLQGSVSEHLLSLKIKNIISMQLVWKIV